MLQIALNQKLSDGGPGNSTGSNRIEQTGIEKFIHKNKIKYSLQVKNSWYLYQQVPGGTTVRPLAYFPTGGRTDGCTYLLGRFKKLSL